MAEAKPKLASHGQATLALGTLRPTHTRNRAVRYRTPACKDCRLKAQCTPALSEPSIG